MLVLMLRGIPGSGKSSFVQKFLRGATVVSADHFFEVDGEYHFNPDNLQQAHEQCWREFLAAVERGDDVIVVDNTNVSVYEIAGYYLPAQSFGYVVKIITLEVPVDVAAARNVHGVSREQVERMAERLDSETDLFPHWWNHSIVAYEPVEEPVTA
jgi:predicted kinase